MEMERVKDLCVMLRRKISRKTEHRGGRMSGSPEQPRILSYVTEHVDRGANHRARAPPQRRRTPAHLLASIKSRGVQGRPRDRRGSPRHHDKGHPFPCRPVCFAAGPAETHGHVVLLALEPPSQQPQTGPVSLPPSLGPGEGCSRCPNGRSVKAEASAPIAQLS